MHRERNQNFVELVYLFDGWKEGRRRGRRDGGLPVCVTTEGSEWV